jgi:putative tryptophan/tyrosine transport system substrate-binding protein
VKRRAFFAFLGGTVAWPLYLSAQRPPKLVRIGYLSLGTAATTAPLVEALRSGLRELGYVEGENLLLEYRRAEVATQLPDLAADLVRANVDVIFAPSSDHVAAAKRVTTTIPIVFAAHADPVGVGHIASLARPGGNITGMSMLLTELSVKELELLREAIPKSRRIGVLWNPMTPSNLPARRALEVAAETLKAELVMVPIRTHNDIEGAFSRMVAERVDAFLVVASPLTNSGRAELVELALRHRLPGMFGLKVNAEAGGLMSYGADLFDLYRRAAVYIDKIVKGAKPADLAVEQASKFEFVVNLQTARALGITFPQSILLRADQVIE